MILDNVFGSAMQLFKLSVHDDCSAGNRIMKPNLPRVGGSDVQFVCWSICDIILVINFALMSHLARLRNCLMSIVGGVLLYRKINTTQVVVWRSGKQEGP